ncbi:MAG: DUF1080 domain-containing protein [Theionarchaea archaeon]|nr:DUF1080 domain-containing protein [Theionarchaea archaeon]
MNARIMLMSLAICALLIIATIARLENEAQGSSNENEPLSKSSYIFTARVRGINPETGGDVGVSGVRVNVKLYWSWCADLGCDWHGPEYVHKYTDTNGEAKFYRDDFGIEEDHNGWHWDHMNKFRATVTLTRSAIEEVGNRYYGVEQIRHVYYDFDAQESNRPGNGGTDSSRDTTFLLVDRENPDYVWIYKFRFLFLHGMGGDSADLEKVEYWIKELLDHYTSAGLYVDTSNFNMYRSSRPNLAYHPDEGKFGELPTYEWSAEIRDHLRDNFNEQNIIIVAHSAGGRAVTRLINDPNNYSYDPFDPRPNIRGVFTLNTPQDYLEKYGTFLMGWCPRDNNSDLCAELFHHMYRTDTLSISEWLSMGGGRKFFSLGSSEDVTNGGACERVTIDPYSDDVDDKTVPLEAMNHLDASVDWDSTINWIHSNSRDTGIGKLIHYGVADEAYFCHSDFKEHEYPAKVIASFVLSRALAYNLAPRQLLGTTGVVYNGDTSGQYSDSIDLKATLTNENTDESIPNKRITFTIGSQSKEAQTNPAGIAQTTMKLNQEAGSYTVETDFAGVEYIRHDFKVWVIEKRGEFGADLSGAAWMTSDIHDGRILIRTWANAYSGITVGYEIYEKKTGESPRVIYSGFVSHDCGLLGDKFEDPRGGPCSRSLPSHDSDPFTISKEDTILAVDDAIIPYGDIATLHANLYDPDSEWDDNYQGVSNRGIRFYLDVNKNGIGDTNELIGTGTTDLNGDAYLNIDQAGLFGVPAGTYTLLAQFCGDNYYERRSNTATIAVFGEGAVLLNDNFSDGDHEGWTVINGDWLVSQGQLFSMGSGRIAAGTMFWTDYSIKLQAFSYTGSDFAIDFRCDDDGNFYRAQTWDCYKTLRLYKIDSSGIKELASVDLSDMNLGQQQWITWRIAAFGNTILVVLNDKLLINYVDMYNPYLHGKIRLRVISPESLDLHVWTFDDILVRGYAEGTMLLSDNFDDSSYQGWSIIYGDWRVVQGQLFSYGSGYITTGSSTWTDYSVEVRVFIYANSDDVAIDFRWDGGSNRYRMQTWDRYDTLRLYKGNSSGYEELSHANLAGMNLQGWHKWKAMVVGNTIRLYVDNTLVIHYVDMDNPYTDGKVALRVVESSPVSLIGFDDVGVRGFIETPPLRTDDFNDGDYYCWALVSGTWTVENGELSQSDTTLGRTHIETGSAEWMNYSFFARVKFLSEEEEAQFRFRMHNDRKNFYEVWLRGREHNDMAVHRIVDSESKLIGYAPLNFEVKQNVWYRVRIICSNDIFRFYIDDVEILEVRDQTFSKGRISLSTYRTHAHFDDIAVTRLYYPWYIEDIGALADADIKAIPQSDNGIRLYLANNGPDTEQWVRGPWLRKDIPDILIDADTTVTWTQYDKDHALHFALLVRGTDNKDRWLIYSANGQNHADEIGWVDMCPPSEWLPESLGGGYNRWVTFTRNIDADYYAEYTLHASAIKELRVGHFSFTSWLGDHGGTVTTIDFGHDWYLEIYGDDPNADVGFSLASGRGVQLYLDNNGLSTEPEAWVQQPWLRKDIQELAVYSGMTVTWTQYDKRHSLHFALLIKGIDGLSRWLIYSANAENHWDSQGYVNMKMHDPDFTSGYNQWKMYTRDINVDYHDEYGVDAYYIKELRVGALGQNSSHYIYGHHVPLFSDEPT